MTSRFPGLPQILRDLVRDQWKAEERNVSDVIFPPEQSEEPRFFYLCLRCNLPRTTPSHPICQNIYSILLYVYVFFKQIVFEFENLSKKSFYYFSSRRILILVLMDWSWQR
jgi:hypothetical protein